MPVNKLICYFISLLLVFLSSNIAGAFDEILIPRSIQGDKGKYFLLTVNNKGNLIETLHKRVGLASVGYTRTQIACKKHRMREIGYSEGSLESMIIEPTKWFDLVEGSSKSDLFYFVCKMLKK